MTTSLLIFHILVAFQTDPDPVRKIIRNFPHGVMCLAFSPDGKILATGTRPSKDGQDALRLWEVATGKEICQLGDDHTFGCSSAVFSPDGKTLVTNGGPEDTLRLWDVGSRKVRLSVKVRRGVGGCVAVSPDSKFFAASDYGPPIRLYDMQTGKETLAFEGNFKPRAVVFSPDGKSIAASTNEGLVMLWDVATGKKRFSLKKHMRAVNSMMFSPDGKTLYSVGEDWLLIYWDLTTGKERLTAQLKKKARGTTHAALSPDGNTLALLGHGVFLFDVKAAELWSGEPMDYQDGRLFCIAFSPDGKLIATGSGGNQAVSSVYFYGVPQRTKKARD